MTFKLRQYQEECLTFTDLALKDHERVANVLPTGAGKTVIFAHLAQQHLREMPDIIKRVDPKAVRPDRRVLILVHTDELVQQAYDKVRMVNLGTEVGIVKAQQDDVDAKIIVASVQTLRQKARRDRITGVTLIIVDECHHATAPTYRDIIGHFTPERCAECIEAIEVVSADVGEDVLPSYCPNSECSTMKRLRVVGFTATLGRSDDADLSKVWQHVAYRRDILWMIRNEYLIDVKGLHVKVDDLDLKKVKKSRGDFQDAALGQALSDSMAPEVVARALREHGPDRQTICFTPLVSSAYEFADAFSDAGFKAEVVHGALPKHERRAILRRYAEGVTQVLCNAMVLTEGFDAPATSCIIVARPTKSKPLFQQMVGRGLRVDPEKPWAEQGCLVMIVAGAEMHDLRSIVDLTEKEIRPKPGQTLLEAEDEADSESAGAREQKPQWRGATKVKEFDPLMRASRRTWSHTADGVRFLAAGDHYIVLLESAGTIGAWDVCWMNKVMPWDKSTPRRQKRTEYTGLPLDLAMDWGEDVADRMGGEGASMFNTKTKRWRQQRVKASEMSEKYKRLIRSLGVTFEDGVTRKGELGEMVEQRIASQRIDPPVRQYRAFLEEGDRK